jgi:hypothetical protein
MSRTIEEEAALWAKYKPGPTLRPRLWTKEELLTDFRKQADYSKLATTFAEKFTKTLVDQLTPGANGTVTIIERAVEFVKDKIKEKAIGKIVGSVVQTEHESKAEGKMIRRFGTHFVLASISIATHAAFPVALPITALFTIIIYIGEKEKEKQEQWNKDLAQALDKRMKDIRAKAQEKLDERHIKEIEAILMSGAAHDAWEDAVFGSYSYKDEGVVVLRKVDVALVRSCINGPPCNDNDLMFICAILRRKPTDGLIDLTAPQIKTLNSFVQDCRDADFHGIDEH